MEKNWLIRTKNNHILGPVSKQKVRELLEKGSIKGDDELCSGNGYWFYVREKELVEKYITGDIPQSFNPVAECKSVLVKSEVQQAADGETLIPSDDDLAFPDMGDSSVKVPEDDDLAFPEPQADELESEGSTLDELREKASISEKKKVIAPAKKPKHRSENNKIKKVAGDVAVKKSKTVLNQNLLQMLALLFFVLALVAFYFRKRIIKEVINSKVSIISPAYAQVIPNAVKKKFNI